MAKSCFGDLPSPWVKRCVPEQCAQEATMLILGFENNTDENECIQ